MSEPRESKGRMLVVDDEFGPRESLRFLFKDEYEVICKDSVDEGIAELRTTKPDVIILDIKMPGKNGIEGLGEIREVDPIVSVIMLTGFGNLETAQKAIRLGANDYIRKPFDTKEMRETVARYVERTRVARKRANMTRELEELNASLKGDLQDAKHFAALGEASTEFVHDLRNPLTVISGYVQLLLQEMRDPESAPAGRADDLLDYLNLIDRNVSRCTEMSEAWRVLGHKDSLSMQAIEVEAFMMELGKNAEQYAQMQGRVLVASGGDASATIEGDPVQLTRAFQNLVSNAVEASPEEEGRVELTWECVEGKLLVHVHDNGPGMSSRQLEKLFTSHFTTKSEKGGLGVGLMICHKAVSVHDGKLDISNHPEGGLLAEVEIPLQA